MKYLGELPKSDKPWCMAAFGEVIVLVNPEHGAWFVEGDKLKPLTYDAVQPPMIMKMPAFGAVNYQNLKHP